MKRSPLRRKTPMRRGRVQAWNSTLNSVSPRQRRKNTRRTPLKKAYLAAHRMCETGCGQRSEHVHEPWTRGRGGPIDDVRNFLAVCWLCHRAIHADPLGSERRGWLVSAADGPAWIAAGGRDLERAA